MAKQDPDTFSKAEAEAREAETLKRMLATPPKPHDASGKRGKESSQPE